MTVVTHLPVSRGVPFVVVLDGVTIRGTKGAPAGVQRDPNAALGTFTLRLRNVVVGSRYRVGVVSNGALATPNLNAEGVVPGGSGLTDHSLVLDYFAVGNTKNNLRIDIRKGTSDPEYLPFDTLAVAQAGTVDVFVSQILDAIND